MKISSIFFIALVISLGVMLLSLKIADLELGIGTLFLIWGIFLWLYSNKATENSANP